MDYNLKRPCKDCPFRTDVAPYLTGKRAQEIATSLAQGSDFPCHKTTVPVEDEDGSDRMATSDSKMCAGALIMMEKQGTPNQLMRIMGRLGVYNPDNLDMESPVCGSTVDFVRHHSKSMSEWATGVDPDEDDDEEGTPDSCHCVGPGCEAPAGYMVNGSAVPNAGPHDTTLCPSCGEWTCNECWSWVPSRDEMLCLDCAEYENGDDDGDQ